MPPIGILYMTVKVLLDVGMLQVWLMERKYPALLGINSQLNTFILLCSYDHSTIHSYSYSALFYALYADHEEQTITISFENVQN